MKLDSRLQTSPRFLHVVPFLGVVLLLVTFFLLGSNLLRQSGIRVRLPEAASIVPNGPRPQVITLSAGEEPALYFNDQAVTWTDLEAKLEDGKAKGGRILVMGDALAAYGSAIRAGELALSRGYEVIYATQPADAEKPSR